MDIKSKSNVKVTFNTVLWGTDSSVKYFSIVPTVALWMCGASIGALQYFFGSSSLLLMTVLLKGLLIMSLFGIVLAVLSLFGHSDWHKCGQKLWNRVVIYNFIMLAMCMYFKTEYIQQINEPVKMISFFQKNIEDCEYSAILKSKNMEYEFCSEYESKIKVFRVENLRVKLWGRTSLGQSIATHYEIVEEVRELNN